MCHMGVRMHSGQRTLPGTKCSRVPIWLLQDSANFMIGHNGRQGSKKGRKWMERGKEGKGQHKKPAALSQPAAIGSHSQHQEAINGQQAAQLQAKQPASQANSQQHCESSRGQQLAASLQSASG